MAKIYCVCGATILDQNEALRYKARFLADRDRDDFTAALQTILTRMIDRVGANPAEASELVSEAGSAVHEALRTYMNRHIYQCEACGRLYLDDRNHTLHIFAPEDATQVNGLLDTMDVGAQPGEMGGQWLESNGTLGFPRGELWWTVAGGGNEAYDDWDALEDRYYQLFQHFGQHSLLQNAYLIRNAEELHRWSLNDAAAPDDDEA